MTQDEYTKEVFKEFDEKRKFGEFEVYGPLGMGIKYVKLEAFLRISLEKAIAETRKECEEEKRFENEKAYYRGVNSAADTIEHVFAEEYFESKDRKAIGVIILKTIKRSLKICLQESKK